MLLKKIAIAKWVIMVTIFTSLGLGCKKDVPEPTPTPTPKPPAGFVYIKGGSFQMGSGAATGAPSDEQPQHEVTLDAFFMDITELTRGKFFEFLGSSDTAFILNPLERRESYYSGTVNMPVAGVHFNTALLYCNWRSKKEGLIAPYTLNSDGTIITYNKLANGYRLPTEAEWEYACRADTSIAKSPKKYFYGDDSTLLAQYAWFEINSSKIIHEGASRQPNPFGLYDMHGNVSEWVWDWYSNLYDANDNKNPVGKPTGSERVFRGGNCKDWAKDLRSAKRFKGSPTNRYEAVGIRLARNI